MIAQPKPVDLTAACEKVIALAKQQDWKEVAVYAEKLCAFYPDSTVLVGNRMNALFHLGQIFEAADLGILFLQRNPGAIKITRNTLAIFPKLHRVDEEWIPILAQLSSDYGRVLHILTLIRLRKGIDAEKAFWGLESVYPNQEILPVSEFATYLASYELFECAERVFHTISSDSFIEPKKIRALVELLLKLSLKDQPERFGEAKQLAEAFYQKNPDSADAWFALGRVWWEASRMDLSLPFMRRFIEENPDHPIRPGVTFNSIYDETLDPDELFKIHLDWGARLMETRPGIAKDFNHAFDPNRKLKVGYVSSDLGQHPVGYFCIDVIPAHDRDRFEIFIYSERDPVVLDDKLSKAFRESVGDDHWRWTCKLSDTELFDRIREDKIDLFVDLAGHTTGNRMKVFAMRAAPVQVSWLGYPHSTAVPTMDYRISDNIVEPEGESEQWSTEKIVRLPNGFHAIRMPDNLPAASPPPCLKNGYLTFGSFNNVNKMGKQTIEMWAYLLTKLPNSRLLLKHRTLNAFENREGIRSLFALNGVDPGRITFAGTNAVHAQHFAMYERMDIALDPLGYNGTTTTCEALYMGVPVLTFPGKKHASRVSASLLSRLGLHGWIANSKEHYSKIARFAAQHPDLLAERRARLRTDFINSPLNDGQSLARDLENAYTKMWQSAGDQFNPNLNS